MFAARSVLALCVLAVVIAVPAEAAKKKPAHKAATPAHSAAPTEEQPTLLGASRSWTAYQANTGDGRVCYAMGTPKDTQPKGGARDPMNVIISFWPGRNVRDELQIVPGYLYKDNEPVWVQVGNRKVEFFARNDAKGGSAWIKDLDQEADLVRSMRAGKELVVTGYSKKGTKTTDTYSLAGIGAALDRAHQACGK